MGLERTSGPATLEEVARAAGVSLATASRALNGSTRKVNPEYRERVLAAARALNYTPNLAAQAVARGGSSTLALVVADISDPYFSSIAWGAMRAAEERGLVVTIGSTERRPAREAALVRAFRGQRPRSLILVGSRWAAEGSDSELSEELHAFEKVGGRVVMVSQPKLPFRTIDIRNREGAAALAGKLIKHGYRSAAILTGPTGLITAQERTHGFADAFAAHDLPIDERWLVSGDFTRDGGFLGAAELQRRGLGEIEVIFAVNDVMAVGAMAYLRSAGVQLPDEVAVAGFDDISSLRDVTPALTTVTLPLEAIGRKAIELALDDDQDGERRVPIHGTPVLRESTPVRVPA
ncbi:MAG TPA: LacI family DNA-binding transcriptional regulator [Propionibacteriaceae bacterium]|nr:LacI family DNA-binding transcriptional regulator [Propionibacteriaceae bacterium]